MGTWTVMNFITGYYSLLINRNQRVGKICKITDNIDVLYFRIAKKPFRIKFLFLVLHYYRCCKWITTSRRYSLQVFGIKSKFFFKWKLCYTNKGRNIFRIINFRHCKKYKIINCWEYSEELVDTFTFTYYLQSWKKFSSFGKISLCFKLEISPWK